MLRAGATGPDKPPPALVAPIFLGETLATPLNHWGRKMTRTGRPHPWVRDRYGAKDVPPRMTPEQAADYKRDRERMQAQIWSFRRITVSPARASR